MISPIIENRIQRFEDLVDELSVVCENDDRTDYSMKILGELKKIAAVLDDEREDAEDIFEECVKAVREDSMADALKSALEGQWITTKSGSHVHLNEEGQPDIGNPNVIAAIQGAFEQKESNEKSGTGKNKKVGKNVHSSYGSPYPLNEISATGENKPCVGFTKEGLRRHKDGRHKAQYASMTDEQYEKHAINLLKKKCGKDIFGYRCSDGCVCRFNNLTGEYAKGYPGGNVKTCFYPTLLGTDPSKIDIGYARGYYRAMKKEEGLD